MIKPGVAYHPGEYLADALEAKGRSQVELAELVGISRYEINDLIKGRRNITPRIASRLGEALGMPASSWLNLQNMYDLYLISQNDEEISQQEKIRSAVKELVAA